VASHCTHVLCPGLTSLFPLPTQLFPSHIGVLPILPFQNIQGAAKKMSPDENCNFSEVAWYFITKYYTIILKRCLHYYYTFYKILLIHMEMARSEIQSMIFVSCQPAMQNIYLTTWCQYWHYCLEELNFSKRVKILESLDVISNWRLAKTVLCISEFAISTQINRIYNFSIEMWTNGWKSSDLLDRRSITN